jgi:RHS repeat-associated protein
MKQRIFAICAVFGVATSFGVHAQTFSRTDSLTYSDNLSKWVIGQPATSTNQETGVIEYRNVYSANAQLVEHYALGKFKQKVSYATDGTISGLSDARDTSSFNTTVGYSNWKRGIPQLVSFPDGTSMSAVVDNTGSLSSVTNEAGAKTCYLFDPMGRLKEITYPSETQVGVCDTSTWTKTTITFDDGTTTLYGAPAGHWRQTTQTGNGRKILIFDAMWRPIVEQQKDVVKGNTTLSETIRRYDSAGHIAFQSYPMNTGETAIWSDSALKGTRTTYDALGRVTQVDQDSELGILTTTTQFLTNFQTKVTNPRLKSTTTSYYAWDQPTTDYVREIQHPLSTVTSFTRDVFGKPVSLTRRDTASSITATRQYYYNPTQELCRLVEPETKSTLFGYDAAGNLSWSAGGYAVDDGCADASWVEARRVDRTYDQRNRIATLSFPDGRGDTAYDYTPDGLPETLTVNNFSGNAVNTLYEYNKRRLLTKETMAWDLITWPVTYGYNANGHLASQGYPGSFSVSYAPNALGQATQAGTYATGVTYHPNGAIAGFTYGNTITHSMTQNLRQLPERSRDAWFTSTTYLDDNYDYDKNGNVVAISDGATGPRGDRDMNYDDLDRLASVKSLMYSATDQAGTIYFGYDPLDNITSVSAWNRSQRYCYDTVTNRLTFMRTPSGSTCPNGGAATTAFGYDLQGNVNVKNNFAYEFDFGNRLRSTTDGATATTYVYDALGRRVRDITGVSRYTMYTQSGQVAFTSDARSHKATNYVYLGGSLVATRSVPIGGGAEMVLYQHTDALGTPVLVTSSSRGIVQRSEYEPYGTVINRPKEDGVGFTGHVEDAATGLTYMQQRYYDPSVGRFLSVDPVPVRVYGDNFNRYWYGNNNPFGAIDPDGRETYVLMSFQDIQNGRRNNTIVTDGRGGIALHLGAADGRGAVVRDGISRHEQHHKSAFYLNCDQTCGILEGAPADMVIGIGGPNTELDRAMAEVASSQVEIEFLEGEIGKARNRDQRDWIRRRIRDVVDYRQRYQRIVETTQRVPDEPVLPTPPTPTPTPAPKPISPSPTP